MTDTNNLLSIEQLGMLFGGIQALQNVCFSIERDSITALIGPNGAGKTTLFNCLTGFYKATHGQLLFHQNDQAISINQLLGLPFRLKHLIDPVGFLNCLYYKMFGGSHLIARLGIARTFQNIRLFKEMTVVENLLVAQHTFAYRNLIAGLFQTEKFKLWESQAVEKAFYWLDQFELTAQANQLAGSLSYGQQRHLEMARCLCIQPKLLCLDEPAAGLNPLETQRLSEKIVRIKEDHQLTIFLIEHDMSMVMEISDHIVVLDHGEVICQGAPQVVRGDQRVLAAYLGIDQNAA